MNSDQRLLRKVVGRALSGERAHVAPVRVFSGLDLRAAGARLGNFPHSLFQLLNHIIYWQDWVVRWLDGEKPRLPRHASASWQGCTAPANTAEWQRSVRRLKDGLKQLEQRSREVDLLREIESQSRLEMLLVIAAHNSYHIGQAVALRQVLGKWPPPSGGLTW